MISPVVTTTIMPDGRSGFTGWSRGSWQPCSGRNTSFRLSLLGVPNETTICATPMTRDTGRYAIPIYGYISPLLISLTVITNVLICIVLTKKTMRNPTNVLLVAMAMSDMLTGLLPSPCFLRFYTFGGGGGGGGGEGGAGGGGGGGGGGEGGAGGGGGEEGVGGRERDQRASAIIPYEWCFVYKALNEHLPTICHTASIWLTVALAVQRYLWVCHSTLAKRLCTVKNTVRAIVIIYILASLSQSTRFFDAVYRPVQFMTSFEKPSDYLPQMTSQAEHRLSVTTPADSRFLVTSLASDRRLDVASAERGRIGATSLANRRHVVTSPAVHRLVATSPAESRLVVTSLVENSFRVTSSSNSDSLSMKTLGVGSGRGGGVEGGVNRGGGGVKDWDIGGSIVRDTSLTGCVEQRQPFVAANPQLYYNFYYGFRVLFIHLVPCTILVILNALLIHTMSVAQARRDQLIRQNRRVECRRLRESNLTTLMLVAVVGLFLLVEFPLALLFMMLILDKTFGVVILAPGTGPVASLFVNLCIMLSYPINFFIYCAMSRQFRETFVGLFRGVGGLGGGRGRGSSVMGETALSMTQTSMVAVGGRRRSSGIALQAGGGGGSLTGGGVAAAKEEHDLLMESVTHC